MFACISSSTMGRFFRSSVFFRFFRSSKKMLGTGTTLTIRYHYQLPVICHYEVSFNMAFSSTGCRYNHLYGWLSLGSCCHKTTIPVLHTSYWVKCLSLYLSDFLSICLSVCLSLPVSFSLCLSAGVYH